MLARVELRQLAQRITGRYHLDPLSRAETAAYVNHRLKVAGARPARSSPAAALREVHRLSNGIPRIINVICDRALLGAFTQEQHRIGPALVRDAAAKCTAARSIRRGSSCSSARPAAVAVARARARHLAAVAESQRAAKTRSLQRRRSPQPRRHRSRSQPVASAPPRRQRRRAQDIADAVERATGPNHYGNSVCAAVRAVGREVRCRAGPALQPGAAAGTGMRVSAGLVGPAAHAQSSGDPHADRRCRQRAPGRGRGARCRRGASALARRDARHLDRIAVAALVRRLSDPVAAAGRGAARAVRGHAGRRRALAAQHAQHGSRQVGATATPATTTTRSSCGWWKIFSGSIGSTSTASRACRRRSCSTRSTTRPARRSWSRRRRTARERR